MRKRTKLNIISYVLSFALMISIIAISLLAFGKYSLFSTRAIVHSCERIGYYSMLNDEITEEAYEIGIPYGITEESLEDVFEDEKICADVMDYVYSKSSGEDSIVIDTSAFGEKIINNVKEAYTATGAEWTSKQDEALQEYVVTVGNMYQKKIEIPGIDSMIKAIKTYNKVIVVALPLFFILACACIFFLITTRRILYHGLRYITYSIFGTAITLIMIFAAALSNGFIYKINISAPYMRKFFTFLVGHEMLMQIITGIFMGAAGLILVFIIFRLKVGSQRD